MRGPGGMPEGAAVAEEEAVPGLLRTPEERGAWEAALVDALGTLLAGEGKGARLREIEARYTDAHDEGAVFKDELQERTDVGALNEAVRLAAYPGLWRYRRPFTFEQFQASFAREPRLAEEYPVLSELLTRQSELRALRYLPQLFRWLELLMYVLTPQLPVLCSALTNGCVCAGSGWTSAWTSAPHATPQSRSSFPRSPPRHSRRSCRPHLATLPARGSSAGTASRPSAARCVCSICALTRP